MNGNQIERAFGLAIAFLGPGMIVLYAASAHMPVLESWFNATGRGRTTIGSFLSMAVAASAAGVFVSGVRWYLVEKWIKNAANIPTEHETAERREAETELAYQNIRNQHYDFYLFYANTLVALGVLWLCWLPSQFPPLPTWVWEGAATPVLATAAGAATARVLFAAATDSYRRYQNKRTNLLKRNRNDSPTGTPPGTQHG